MPIFTSDLTSRGIIYADTITTDGSNSDITITPNGTGAVVANARFKVNEISADDSTSVSIKSTLQLDSTLQVAGAATIGTIQISGNTITSTDSTQLIHGDTNYNSKQYLLYGTTTDATETELLVAGQAASRVAVATNTTVYYDVNIVGRRTDVTGESAGFHLKAVADNFSGTTADVGTVYEVVVARDDVNWVVDCQADDTTDSIKILVTGAAGKTVRWTAVVRTYEVSE